MATTDTPQQTLSAPSRRGRNLRNRASVKLTDGVARWLITIGGIGTIVTVVFVFGYLAWETAPLFGRARLGEAAVQKTAWGSSAARILHLKVDEYRLIGWALFDDGRLQTFRFDSGAPLEQLRVADDDGPRLVSASVGLGDDSVALGYDNGSVRLGEIAFVTSFPREADLPAALRELPDDGQAAWRSGIVDRTPQGALRLQEVRLDLKEPVQVGEAPIRLIDHVVRERGPVFAVLTGEGRLQLNTVRERRNLLTDEVTYKARTTELPFEPRGAEPESLLLLGQGESVCVAWPDGLLRRFDTRSTEVPQLAEEVDLVPAAEGRLTTLRPLLGRATLLAGDSAGQTTAWFRVRRERTSTPDGQQLVAAHTLAGEGAAVTALASSTRARMAAVGYADGTARLFYVPTHQMLAEARVAEGRPVEQLLVTPKDDGLVATSGGRLWRGDFEPGHPEATLGSLFTPVWYEGYAEPDHVWQSGGGTEDLEPKLGLWPLVFGTLKATFYSMLFGAPLALLAAIYTSEFLAPRTRSRIKPTIELMASLPSVVLGFLAALVFAPYIETVIPAALSLFVTVPLTFLAGATLWQLLPYAWTLRLARSRFGLMLAALPIGIWAAFAVGPRVERWLFAGDIRAWLDGQVGSGTGGWMILLIPAAALATAMLINLVVNPALRNVTADWSRGAVARLSLLKFVLGAVATLAVALAISAALSAAGLDPRGSYIDTYVQRNALVVGFVMGFAIIPIIYTLADDALRAVPNHLRAGSLGAGATPWQTAVRIVIPTAMSGLFSALMIGLGRAVGETMIVLMAAGNTPLREWNIFNGFRTLSANIAVELPEAARHSTHFRTLFLAALTLFVLTFLVNTAAELVRLRFRRRAYQL